MVTMYGGYCGIKDCTVCHICCHDKSDHKRFGNLGFYYSDHCCTKRCWCIGYRMEDAERQIVTINIDGKHKR